VTDYQIYQEDMAIVKECADLGYQSVWGIEYHFTNLETLHQDVNFIRTLPVWVALLACPAVGAGGTKSKLPRVPANPHRGVFSLYIMNPNITQFLRHVAADQLLRGRPGPTFGFRDTEH
jgi:hypothetical protein